MPIQKLWNENGFVEANKIKNITKAELVEMLKQGSVEFVIANISENLKWIPLNKCYENWAKTKNQVVQDLEKFDLESFPNNFAFVASEWSHDNQARTILLEKHH